ncbi:acyltransferase [uncultured Shimia sp.]|uniref:acyltransferase family protein n=1 Tax=uncultured Shimia sp. TaxID=573152 RepID=UPI0026202F3C|nr:acyltransferase [uncultured Shimia sp.]
MVADGPETGRQTWIDALRLCAGVSMVGLHVTADAHGQPFPDADPAARLAPMVLRALLYTARTELFLMISILLLLMALTKRPRSYGAVLREQARRLLIPFVFWTVAYAVYNLLKATAFGYEAQVVAALSLPATWGGYLLLGDVKYHMHFIPTLFALLVFFPLFRLAERRPLLGLTVVLGLLLKQVLDPVMYKLFWGTEALGYAVRGLKVVSYLGYGMAAGAVLGLWRRTTAAQREAWFGPIVVIALALLTLKLMATAKVVATGHWVFDNPFAYWADYLMPVALLLLCLSLAHMAWPAWIARASKYAFGLYLCHPIFLDLAEMALAGRAVSPSQSVALEFLWTLPMTWLFVVALSRHRLTAWTVGLGPSPDLPLLWSGQQA